MAAKRRIVLAITGATGSIIGWRLQESLAERSDVESHLIVSAAGAVTIASEIGRSHRELKALADIVHSDKDIGAAIASGSFKTDAMIIAPCSMRTLSAVATGNASTLITRAADVVLKERRRLVLMVRETPLHLVHLRNMVSVTEMGGIIFPPVPAFYAELRSIDDMVEQMVARALELVGLEVPQLRRWPGISPA